MAVHSKLQEFPGLGWSSREDRLIIFFEANDVVLAGEKNALQLMFRGVATYKTVRAPVAPRSPVEVEFRKLSTIVREHFGLPNEVNSREETRSVTNQ